MIDRYYARSASNKTDDWPFWFVADSKKGGLNVTAELVREFIDPEHEGGVFTSRKEAESLATIANNGKDEA